MVEGGEDNFTLTKEEKERLRLPRSWDLDGYDIWSCVAELAAAKRYYRFKVV